MKQQDAKNLITLEKFLDSLQDIISSFKSYVDSTNKRIDNLDKTIIELSKKINESTSIIRETKKDSLNKIDNLEHQITIYNDNLLKSLGDLVREIKSLKVKIVGSNPKKEIQKKNGTNKRRSKRKSKKNDSSL